MQTQGRVRNGVHRNAYIPTANPVNHVGIISQTRRFVTGGMPSPDLAVKVICYVMSAGKAPDSTPDGKRILAAFFTVKTFGSGG